MMFKKEFLALLILTGVHSHIAAVEHTPGLIERPTLAPEFQFPAPDGTFGDLSQYRGKVLIVNFWASWCIPCRKELPSMNRAWAKFKNEPIAMLAINVGDDRDAVLAFVEDFPIDFDLLLDRDGRVSQRWEVNAMPTTFVVNPGGELVYKIIGSREWDDAGIMQLVRDQRPVN